MGSQIRESSQMLRTDEVTDLLWKLHLGNSLRREYILPHSHQEAVQSMLCSETKMHTETRIPLWQLGLFVLAWVYMLLALSRKTQSCALCSIWEGTSTAPTVSGCHSAQWTTATYMPGIASGSSSSILWGAPYINMSTNLPPADPIPKQWCVKVVRIQGTSPFNLTAIINLFLLFPNIVPCWGSHWQRMAGSCVQASILTSISHVTGAVFTNRREHLKVYLFLIYAMFLEIKRNSR